MRNKLKSYSLVLCLFVFLFVIIGGGLHLNPIGAFAAALSAIPSTSKPGPSEVVSILGGDIGTSATASADTALGGWLVATAAAFGRRR